jgi:hypothetical protein
MPVVASCRCGQRFLAQDHLLGRQVSCPACGSPLLIPLSDGPDLALAPQAQPAALHPRKPNASAGKSSQWLWILGGSGALAALVLVLLVVAAFSVFGGKKNVAKSDPVGSADSIAQLPPLPRRRAPTFDRPAAPPPPRATGSNPFETPAATSTKPATPPALAEVGGAGNSNLDSPDFGKSAPGATASTTTKRVVPAVASRSLAALPHGVTAWHQQEGRSLTGILQPAKDDPTIAHLSWMTGLLPYLGYQEKFSELQLADSLVHAANLEVAKTVIPEFQNPLDDRKSWDGHPFDGLALTHFAGMSGVEDARNVTAAKLPRSDPRAGVFGYDEIARPAAITDGTSQTIMIVGSGRLAGPWLMGGGSTIRGAREPLFDPISGLGTQGLSGGGTMVVMADGSVRHVLASIDPAVFKAMCTIHGQDSADLQTHSPSFDVKDLR